MKNEIVKKTVTEIKRILYNFKANTKYSFSIDAENENISVTVLSHEDNQSFAKNEMVYDLDIVETLSKLKNLSPDAGKDEVGGAFVVKSLGR